MIVDPFDNLVRVGRAEYVVALVLLAPEGPNGGPEAEDCTKTAEEAGRLVMT
jgi:hypothetical protein